MKHLSRIIVIALTAIALVAPAGAAHATNPAKGGRYEDMSGNVVRIDKTGKKVKQLFIQSGATQCSPVPYNTAKVKPAIKKGKFVWKGKLKSMIGEVKPLKVVGVFSGKGGSKLKVTVTDASCHTKNRVFKFTLKR